MINHSEEPVFAFSIASRQWEWNRLLESFLTNENKQLILPIQNHSFWWLGDAESQGISCHSIDIVLQSIFLPQHCKVEYAHIIIYYLIYIYINRISSAIIIDCARQILSHIFYYKIPAKPHHTLVCLFFIWKVFPNTVLLDLTMANSDINKHSIFQSYYFVILIKPIASKFMLCTFFQLKCTITSWKHTITDMCMYHYLLYFFHLLL